MAKGDVELADLIRIVAQRGQAGRSITAIAGAPGSGKSTLAETLVEALNREEPDSAAVLPMDGFHYDDLVLNARGWRLRKGAPHTFDVAGFGTMLRRLAANDEPEIAVPVFDRSLEIARAGARIIPQTVRHLIVEGNYLLLGRDPWASLFSLYETTVFLNVPEALLTARLKHRWAALTPDDLTLKMEGNDLPNVRLVIQQSVAPEIMISVP